MITTSAADHQTIIVTYTSNLALDVNSVDANDLIVARDGFASLTLPPVTRRSVVRGADLQQLTATYRIDAPVGTWNAVDNGTYGVTLRGNQVFDNSISHLAARQILLGKFAVSIDDPMVFFVNTTDDLADGVLSHGLISDTTATPTASLRATIRHANSLSGVTIVVPDGVYALTRFGAGEDLGVLATWISVVT